MGCGWKGVFCTDPAVWGGHLHFQEINGGKVSYPATLGSS